MEDAIMNRCVQQLAAAGTAGLAILLLAGCAQAPTERLEAAQKAVDAAKATGAPEYAKEEFAQLQQQFGLAKDELAKQEQTISVFRSYTAAEKLLTDVVQASQQVEAKTVERKEAARTAALALEKEAQQVVASAKELMAHAPTGKERAAVEAIKADLGGLETGLGAVHQLIEQGNYLGARLQAKAVKEKGSAISAEIQNAIAKAKGKKAKAHA
jgi:hypothetical protein